MCVCVWVGGYVCVNMCALVGGCVCVKGANMQKVIGTRAIGGGGMPNGNIGKELKRKVRVISADIKHSKLMLEKLVLRKVLSSPSLTFQVTLARFITLRLFPHEFWNHRFHLGFKPSFAAKRAKELG